MYSKLRNDMGGILYSLRFLAGFKDTVTVYLFVLGVATYNGHMSNAILHILNGNREAWVTVVWVIIAFFLGGVVSGIVYTQKKFTPTKRSALIPIIMGIAYFVLAYIDPADIYVVTFFAFTLGIQNGINVYYDGEIIRTNIITGPLTMLSRYVGALFHGDKTPGSQWAYQALNLFWYLLGVFIAGAIQVYIGWNLIFITGILDILIGLYFYKVAGDFEKAEEQKGEKIPAEAVFE